eukprot:403356493
MEIDIDQNTIRSYINNYQGHTRYQRLLALVEKQPKYKFESLRIALELAKQEKKLFFYYEVVKILRRQFHEHPEQCPISDFGTDSNFDRTVSQDYKNEVKKKEQEIQQLQKSLLRDSMRIAFNELGKIHYSYGYLSDAIKSWVKSHDFSTDQDDLFQMAFQIAQAAYEAGSQSYLIKYSGEAEARDKGKNNSQTMQIKILDAMSSLFQEKFSTAAHRFVNITISDPQILSQYLTAQDLAYYIIITSLHSLGRSELKKSILGGSNFKNLMEAAPQVSEIIENFLNGKYQEFQDSLTHIVNALKFDINFGHKIHQIVGEIRKKALIQYVIPYKVIDMNEIAKAFDLSIEQIEAEIAELIVSKKIQAKIDSHSKLLYSRKDNETLNSYKEAVNFGRVFIQETENALLRVNVLQKNKVLKPVNMITQNMSSGSGGNRTNRGDTNMGSNDLMMRQSLDNMQQ